MSAKEQDILQRMFKAAEYTSLEASIIDNTVCEAKSTVAPVKSKGLSFSDMVSVVNKLTASY